MDYDRLWMAAERARSGKRMTTEDVGFVRNFVPEALGSFPNVSLPKTVRHPGGFSVSGAPVGTFLRSALLLAGQKCIGNRYEGSAFYEAVEQDLAFGIMRSHFHRGFPKGTHCCVQCTLAVYPVLESGGIKYFDSLALSRDVRRLIENGGWRFNKTVNTKMIRWALSDWTG